jgi:hypothetical protein
MEIGAIFRIGRIGGEGAILAMICSVQMIMGPIVSQLLEREAA